MASFLLFPFVFVGLLIYLVVWFIRVYNRLVAARNACANARSSVDVNLTKRHELIPNLVRATKGYMEHEKETLAQITTARTNAMAALGSDDSPASEAKLDVAIGQLNMRIEAYPELKADGLFRELVKNLTEVEEQISASRRTYNAYTLQINNIVQQFPTSIVAAGTGFRQAAFFEAATDSRATPKIDLFGTHA